MYFNNGCVIECLDRNSEAIEDLNNIYIWIITDQIFIATKTNFLGNSSEKLITHFMSSLLHCSLKCF